MDDIEEYLEFRKGNIPLIISVPHGGTLECSEIPRRSNGILGIDKATIKLAKELINYIHEEKDSFNPSYIISRIRRNKIDLNRDEFDAFNNSSIWAKQYYTLYHSKIRELVLYNLKNFQKSLLIDIHGFEKEKRPPGFRNVELVLGTNNLKTLFKKDIPYKDIDKNIRGELIKKFNVLGIPVAPGLPRRKEYVLTGGYIVQKYGASEIDGSQSIQIEFSDVIRIIDKDLRKLCLKTIKDVIIHELL